MLRQVFATIVVHGSQSIFQPSPSPPLESDVFDPALFRSAVLALRLAIALLPRGLSAGRGAVQMPAVTTPVHLEIAATPGTLDEVVFQVPSVARETGLRAADPPCCRRFPAVGYQHHQGPRVAALGPTPTTKRRLKRFPDVRQLSAAQDPQELLRHLRDPDPDDAVGIGSHLGR